MREIRNMDPVERKKQAKIALDKAIEEMNNEEPWKQEEGWKNPEEFGPDLPDGEEFAIRKKTINGKEVIQFKIITVHPPPARFTRNKKPKNFNEEVKKIDTSFWAQDGANIIQDLKSDNEDSEKLDLPEFGSETDKESSSSES